jgi:hypothetical protein
MSEEKEQSTLKRWEIVLITFSLLISMSAVVLYVSGIPVRYFLNSFNADLKEVGKISDKSGVVRLRITGEMVFQEVGKEAPVHNLDFLVTNDNSKAAVLFEDGTSFEMGESSMVQISYESQFTLAGIVRAPKVMVVQGRVTATSTTKNVTLATRNKTISVPANSTETVDTDKELMKAAAKPEPTPTPTPTPTMTVAEDCCGSQPDAYSDANSNSITEPHEYFSSRRNGDYKIEDEFSFRRYSLES